MSAEPAKAKLLEPAVKSAELCEVIAKYNGPEFTAALTERFHKAKRRALEELAAQKHASKKSSS